MFSRRKRPVWDWRYRGWTGEALVLFVGACLLLACVLGVGAWVLHGAPFAPPVAPLISGP